MPNVSNVILEGILKPIDLLLEKNHYRSALVLLYSGIDTMAFINLPPEKEAVTRMDYVAWVDQYIKFPCAEQVKGIELYAARCGVLHTFTPDSELSRKNKVRRIIYVSAHTPEVSYNPSVAEDVVLLSVYGFFTAFIDGVQQFLGDLQKDKERETQGLKRIHAMFHEIPHFG